MNKLFTGITILTTTILIGLIVTGLATIIINDLTR